MNRLLQRFLLCVAMMGLLSIATVKDAESQELINDLNWQVLSADVSWLGTSGHPTRGIAHNPATGNFLVASRADGTQVIVLDGLNGSEIGSLDMSGVSGGFYTINRIAVTDDGNIFVANFSLNGPEYRVYWWDDENAAPVRVFDGDPYGTRIGDGFGVTGTGQDIKVYASGTFSDELVEWSFNVTGDSLDQMRIIQLPGDDHANASIVAAPDEEALWINGRDASILKIDLDGNVLVEIGSDVVALGNGEMDLIEMGGRKFLITGVPGAEDNIFSLIDITHDFAPYVVATTEDLTINSNTFRIGGVAFDQANENVVVFPGHSGIFNFALDIIALTPAELIGPYFVPQGDNPRGFDNLGDAFTALNTDSIIGPVSLVITGDTDAGAVSLRIDREDLTPETRITIRPLPGETPTVTAKDIRFVDTGYITIDGSANGDGERDLTFVKNDDQGGFIGLLSDTRDIFIRNINVAYLDDHGAGTYAFLINRREGATETGRGEGNRFENIRIGTELKPFNDGFWMFGSTTIEDFFHKDNVFDGNEFHVGRSALRTQTHTNTVFDNNIVKLYGSTGIQGINLNTPIESFTARNNEFEFVGGSVSDATVHVAINITNTLVEANFHNNTFAVNYDGDGLDHSFYAIRHAGGATTGPLNFYHNSFRIGDTGQSGTHAVLGRTEGASTGLTVNMTNNIMVSDRDAANSIAYEWGSGTLNANYNNIYMAGDGIVGKIDEDTFETIPAWTVETGNDQRSVAVDVNFVSNTDLRLTGGSIGDISLAGTPIAEVTTDIDGNARDADNPYMGAFEGDIVLIPEPVVRDFVLLQPESGSSVDLGEVEELAISWEYPQSTVAWSRMNGQFADDQFAHVGGGDSGEGRYIGTDNDVDAWLQTPLLINPGTLSFWASTYSNNTELEMVIEKSADGENWVALETLSAEAGGTGDINVDWSYHEVLIDEEGEYYVRFSQSGDVSGSFYLDDVEVTSSVFIGDYTLDEDFEQWESFRSLRFTWHLDAADAEDDPDLSLTTDRNGEAATMTLTASQADAALASIGVDSGETFNGSWTVTASLDGAVYQADAPFSINITRIVPTGSDVEQPFEFALNQNYPNPFNPTTKIEYSIPETMEVRLDVFNVVGQRVATLVNEQREAGVYTVEFNGARLASGVYIYRIQAGSFVKTHKMTLVK